MLRERDSRKGENGSVTVIGGSLHMHGAPIFSALAAEASGVDLVHICVPECHAEVTKSQSLNFMVTPFRNNDLSKSDVSALEDIIAKSKVAVIGPGLATFDTAQSAIRELIAEATVPMVLDASALQPWTFDALAGRSSGAPNEQAGTSIHPAVLTPHIGELSRMQGQVLESRDMDAREDIVSTIAKARNVTMILKGAKDFVAGLDGKTQEVTGGNAGLTVGGTGDALAGLIAGLMAQGINPFDACVQATTIIKRAATILYEEKGYAFTTRDVIGEIPHLIHTYDN